MKVETKIYKKDSFIYLDGKFNLKEFYIVKSGNISIKKKNELNQITEETKGPGYIFGIIQTLTGISDNETVKAITDCEILVIPKEKLEQLYVEHKKIILKILSEYSEILRNLDKELVKIDFFTDDNFDRETKVFEIAKRYVLENQKEKAAHLLKSFLMEIKGNSALENKILNILENLPDVEIFKSNDIITEKIFKANTVVFTEFEMGNNFFIIKKGKVKITKLKHNKEMLLAILSEGDIFGEMSILNDKPRNATAFVIENSELTIVDKKGIDKLPPPLFVKILYFLTRRIWFVQQQIICNKISAPIAQIYYFLTAKIRLAIPNIKKDDDKTFVFNFSLQELYEMLDIDKDKEEKIKEFLTDKNIEFSDDSIKIKKTSHFLDKASFYFTRSNLGFI
ncbi:MAG TPA: cyclic nucleotide-binding domain-containing protein [Spirochaetota bacterium]|nr:cyclic nucleotide-binding domain-containing protein [Spirochaetota bacterium]HOL56299.1 cyclic nucleotide-binding domain-containing protein [Spirochaetota bacterium]HPP03689.1 cyclic nucleotide-binding domain-containing protein [Spirochaetota bacterium]